MFLFLIWRFVTMLLTYKEAFEKAKSEPPAALIFYL